MRVGGGSQGAHPPSPEIRAQRFHPADSCVRIENADPLRLVREMWLSAVLGRDDVRCTGSEGIAICEYHDCSALEFSGDSADRTYVPLETDASPVSESSPGAPVHEAPNPAMARAGRPSPTTDDERDLLLSSLSRHGFNITKTAKELNVSRVTLYRMLRRNRLILRQRYVVSAGMSGPYTVSGGL